MRYNDAFDPKDLDEEWDDDEDFFQSYPEYDYDIYQDYYDDDFDEERDY